MRPLSIVESKELLKFIPATATKLGGAMALALLDTHAAEMKLTQEIKSPNISPDTFIIKVILKKKK